MTLSTEPEAAAEAVVNEIAKRTEAPFIGVLQVVSGNRLQPLATYSRSAGVQPRRSAAAGRTAAAISWPRRAIGPWAEPVPEPEPGEAANPFFSVGMALVAGAPIYAGDTLVGVLNIGGESEYAVPSLGEQAKLMAAAIDYASILTAVAGPALADRRRRSRSVPGSSGTWPPTPSTRSSSRSWRSRRAQVVGFEALTRFNDGTPPDMRFAEAAALGLGDEYELAATRGGPCRGAEAAGGHLPDDERLAGRRAGRRASACAACSPARPGRSSSS